MHQEAPTSIDALSLPWEDLDPYAFPPTAILGKVEMKLRDYLCKRIILIAQEWPNIPFVRDLVAIPGHHLSVTAQCAKSTIKSDYKQESAEPKSPCVAPRASAIWEQGFSEAVAAPIEAPQRVSARSVFEAKSIIFTKWCHNNQLDFRAPPINSIPDFPLYLFHQIHHLPIIIQQPVILPKGFHGGSALLQKLPPPSEMGLSRN